MLNLKQTIKNHYYRYNPGEFLPVYSGGELINKRDFHTYRIKWLLSNHRIFLHQLTHQRG
jgi:hypothetical protein